MKKSGKRVASSRKKSSKVIKIRHKAPTKKKASRRLAKSSSVKRTTRSARPSPTYI